MLHRIVVVSLSLLLVSGSVLARESRPAHRPQGGSTQHSENARRHSDAKRIERARVAVDAMSIRSDNVHRQLRKARARKHATRARCLDGMLSQIHAVERQAREQLGAIQRRRARTLAGSGLQRIRTLSSRSQELLVEASRCGKPYSKRQRVKTGYTVRLIKPPLPRPSAPADIPRRPLGS